ncbi:Ankyrin repeat-containing protein [Artemisia annua]|uniref:Ankyrin repeat-containing protein n=1 Tax=Artemisia annua TaxID=35608 RepID=A0A2U1KPE1_ARTAN|nr:Ankyrin repeat-containing protein [Artemisia annua]
MAGSSNADADAERQLEWEYNRAYYANVSNFVTVKLSGRENYEIWYVQMLCLLEAYNMQRGFNPYDYQHNSKIFKIVNQYDNLLKGWLFEKESHLAHWPVAVDDVSPNDKVSTKLMMELVNATKEGSWWKAKAILKNHKDADATNMVMNSNGDTMLHLAVKEGKIYFLNQLLNFIKDGSEIKIMNSEGYTALHTAVIVDNKQAAELLVNKSNELLHVHRPLLLAYEMGQINTFLYLLEVTENGLGLLHSHVYRLAVNHLFATATSTKQYNLALKLLEKPDFLTLAAKDDAALMVLTTDFPHELAFWEELIYPFPVAVFCLIYLLIRIIIFVLLLPIFMLYPHLWKGLVYAGLPIKHIEKKKRDYGDAIEVLKMICREINKVRGQDFEKFYRRPILEAASVDACEVVVQILSSDGSAHSYTNESEHNVFQLAILNRSEKIYNYLSPGIKRRSNSFRLMCDPFQNMLTHLAANLASSIVLSRTTGAALQLQRELQWHEEVKKLMLPIELTITNSYKETSEMIFTREHADLLKEAEQWLKTTAESCSITAALIVTIVFAAAITVPGGSNQETGIPLFKKEIAFTIFAVCDAISLFTAATALLVFLSILTTRFAAKDFMISLPRRLIFGLCALSISTIAMMVAFGAILFLVFCDQRPWMLAPIGLFSCLPISVIVTLQLPLLVDLFQSTYIVRFN